MRNVNFHQEPGCITGKCSPGMKVDSKLQKPVEALVRDGGGGSYGDESKTIVTESCT